MLFRAVVYGEAHSININWIDTKNIGNWFTSNRRAYRIDREAVCQVLEKGQRIKGTVEALYIEGNPIPIRSVLDSKTITLEHLNELIAESTNKPQRSFLDMLLRR